MYLQLCVGTYITTHWFIKNEWLISHIYLFAGSTTYPKEGKITLDTVGYSIN